MLGDGRENMNREPVGYGDSALNWRRGSTLYS
jgi:hypothetical protein